MEISMLMQGKCVIPYCTPSATFVCFQTHFSWSEVYQTHSFTTLLLGMLQLRTSQAQGCMTEILKLGSELSTQHFSQPEQHPSQSKVAQADVCSKPNCWGFFNFSSIILLVSTCNLQIVINALHLNHLKCKSAIAPAFICIHTLWYSLPCGKLNKCLFPCFSGMLRKVFAFLLFPVINLEARNQEVRKKSRNL